MSNEILNSLLQEYERKRMKSELDLEKRKNNLYTLIPELQKIENNLNNYSIQYAKDILLNSSSNLDSLNLKIEDLKKQKKQILLDNNIQETYLKPLYECSVCKDTGYLMLSNKGSEMCNCLKQKLLNASYNKSNMSKLDKENFNNFNENKFSDEVNVPTYQQNISPRKNIINIKNKCLEFIDNFENPNYKNLLFTGNTGLGKTFMTNCIAKEILNKGYSVLYQTAPVLLETLIDNKFNKYKNSEQDMFYKSILEVDLLIIDDLGTEYINAMKLSELFTILNTRLLNLNSKCTKTIISTNLTINDIFRKYEERICSRIGGYYDIYYFFGEDLRLK
ncbi:MAG: ATP-binding protein [Clostridia bacterium]|nr:ATP-binding protein [Clostridia bacterium]